MRIIGSVLAGILFSSIVPAKAAVLHAGTNLEVRLSSATGSRFSHSGDGLEATVIAPVFEEGRMVIPQRATLSGYVEDVDRLGFGLKHRTARIQYHFDSLQLPGGSVVPIDARVAEVETAKERVGPDGSVGGINPSASLSSGVTFLISALSRTTEFTAPAIGIKFLIARSPDPEIYLPAGTEMLVQLMADANVTSQLPPTSNAAPLSPEELGNVDRMLREFPRQQTRRKDGATADLTNVMLLGSPAEIERAFYGAGWVGEQPHSALALYRMYHATVQRIGYSMAPMTRLTLNGAQPMRVYQKSLDTFAKRHHIRLWQVNESVMVGASTEDVSYRFRHMHVSHATDPEIDNERAKVVNDLWFTGCVDAASLVNRQWYRPMDQEGESLRTDGKIAVLRMNSCEHPRLASTSVASHRPRPRAVQILAAMGDDFTRSNPLSLGYMLGKSLVKSPVFHRSTGATEPSNALVDGALAWKRPSMINTVTSAKAD